LWVSCCEGIARIDPDTGEHLVDVTMDGAFTVGDEGVWILTEAEGLQEVDPTTGDLSAGSGPFDGSLCGEGWKDLVVAFGSGWLACKIGDVVRIDIETGEANVIPTGPGAHTFLVTEDAVWVTNYQEGGSVSRLDPATGEVRTTPGAGAGIGITYGDGYIWASTGTGIAQLDPESGEILREFRLGSGWFYELVWDDGIIWASTTTNKVLKVDPYD
jgi:streptogramin lyase